MLLTSVCVLAKNAITMRPTIYALLRCQPEDDPEEKVATETKEAGVGLLFNRGADNRGWAVKTSIKGSPAEASGQILEGDVLVSVDGRPVEEVSRTHMCSCLTSPAGTDVHEWQCFVSQFKVLSLSLCALLTLTCYLASLYLYITRCCLRSQVPSLGELSNMLMGAEGVPIKLVFSRQGVASLKDVTLVRSTLWMGEGLFAHPDACVLLPPPLRLHWDLSYCLLFVDSRANVLHRTANLCLHRQMGAASASRPSASLAPGRPREPTSGRTQTTMSRSVSFARWMR